MQIYGFKYFNQILIWDPYMYWVIESNGMEKVFHSPRAPEQEPRHHMQFSIIPKTTDTFPPLGGLPGIHAGWSINEKHRFTLH